METFLTIFLVLIARNNAFPAGNLSGSTRIDVGIGGISNKLPALSTAVVNQKPNFLKRIDVWSGLIPERPKGLEQAAEEHPSIVQKADSIYDHAQQFVINFLHPKPITDTISENEKYGNEGDQFRAIGNAIVGGYEGFSNLINSAVDLPFETMKQVTRKASSYLSGIGAKLVGL